ncbi:MAG: hypothetical protein JWQ88_751 [Rhodoferax sp.]|nr:hypothetical protein [Rhodoferax sp.]
MNRLPSSLAALLLGVAACTSVLASPTDATVRAIPTPHAFGQNLMDHPGGMVRTSFSTSNGNDSGRSKMDQSSFGAVSQPSDGNMLIQFLEDLPQSRLFTFLAAVGVLFVIAKRRLAAEQG